MSGPYRVLGVSTSTSAADRVRACAEIRDDVAQPGWRRVMAAWLASDTEWTPPGVIPPEALADDAVLAATVEHLANEGADPLQRARSRSVLYNTVANSSTRKSRPISRPEAPDTPARTQRPTEERRSRRALRPVMLGSMMVVAAATMALLWVQNGSAPSPLWIAGAASAAVALVLAPLPVALAGGVAGAVALGAGVLTPGWGAVAAALAVTAALRLASIVLIPCRRTLPRPEQPPSVTPAATAAPGKGVMGRTTATNPTRPRARRGSAPAPVPASRQAREMGMALREVAPAWGVPTRQMRDDDLVAAAVATQVWSAVTGQDAPTVERVQVNATYLQVPAEAVALAAGLADPVPTTLVAQPPDRNWVVEAPNLIDDAARYAAEVRDLWGIWVAGRAALLLDRGGPDCRTYAHALRGPVLQDSPVTGTPGSDAPTGE